MTNEVINQRFVRKHSSAFDRPASVEIVPTLFFCVYRKCGKRVSAWSDSNPQEVFCNETCRNNFSRDLDRAFAEIARFAEANKDIFYRHRANAQALVDMQEELRLEPTATNFEKVFIQLLAERKLLLPLTAAQVERMSPEEYAAREKIDPAMGGADLSQLVNRGRGKEPTVFSATQNNRQIRAEMIEQAHRQMLAAQSQRRRG